MAKTYESFEELLKAEPIEIGKTRVYSVRPVGSRKLYWLVSNSPAQAALATSEVESVPQKALLLKFNELFGAKSPQKPLP